MDRQLIKYLPEYLREYREIKEICKCGQQQVEILWINLNQAWDSQFIKDAGKAALTRYEKMLGTNMRDSYNLEERRNKILSIYAEQRPYTIRKLKRILETICGEQGCIIEVNGYHLTIKIALSSEKMLQDIEEKMRRIVPCNIGIAVIVLYNTHEMLGIKTHQKLAVYKHYELRHSTEIGGQSEVYK